MTTFVTRQTARGALVTLFEGTNKWDKVYGYQPNSFNKRASVLTIRSGGTQWSMASQHTNPTAYHFIVVSYIIVDDTASWNADEAEDQLDELGRVFRQTIRDNVGSIAGADYLQVPDSPSTTGFVFVSSVEYRFEEFEITAHYVAGS